MKKLYCIQTVCPDCNHIWYLITDDSVELWQYYLWFLTAGEEHLKLREEREQKDKEII